NAKHVNNTPIKARMSSLWSESNDLGNESHDQLRELFAGALADNHHLAVIDLRRGHPRRDVCDARYGEYLHSTMPGHDDFGHRRHSNRVGPQLAHHSDFCG